MTDRNIPYDINSPGVRGPGPHDSIINANWYYYEQKPDVMTRWAAYKNSFTDKNKGTKVAKRKRHMSTGLVGPQNIVSTL